MRLVIMGGLGVLLILVGYYLYRLRLRDHAHAVAALAWPRARGRITASSVGTVQEASANVDDPLPNTFYVPEITFAYEVSGATYQGARVSYADPKQTNKKKVADLVARYPAGAEVQVAYDPANPAESVLEPGTAGTSPFSFNVIFLFAAGAVCLVVGIYLQLALD